MAWVEVHQSLPTHKKTVRVANALGIEQVHAVGHLVTLWLWALDNAPDGDLDDATDGEIAFYAQWRGDATQFVDALRSAHFLDGNQIHNWTDYAGRLIQARARNKQRMRDARAAHVPNTNNARAGATVPNPTVPNRTQPSKSARAQEDTAFSEFWAVYPKKKAKADALKAWVGLKPTPDLCSTIMAAVEKQKQTSGWMKDNGEFVPYPATWLRAQRWEDEVNIAQEGSNGKTQQYSSNGRGANVQPNAPGPREPNPFADIPVQRFDRATREGPNSPVE